jgi:ferritin-like metal-binding protein YciE
MFDKIETPSELFAYKLGAALTMENTVLGMLGDLEESAQQDELKRQFRHHADETREQIRNLEQAFSALGQEPEAEPSPAIEGLAKDGKQNIKQTDDSLVDHVVLSAAGETEHHEIAVYEALILHASAMGQEDVVALLAENLEQEQHTLGEILKAMKKLDQETAQAARSR